VSKDFSLKELRRRIDLIDSKITKLLNQRASLSLKIGRLKAKDKSPAYAPDRESQVYERIASQAQGVLSPKALQAIYREIMSACLALEKSLKIGYLGPPATFTHLAAIKKFGSQVEYIDCPSIKDIFIQTQKGRLDFGVVPIENSIEGAVDYTLDMFIDSELKICSEVTLEVSHNLLSNYDIKKIKRVYSNPQVFGQCKLWLEKNLSGAERIEVSSTSRAAEIASKEKNSAAIASLLAAKVYNLKALAQAIEDSEINITRFLIIGKTQPPPTGKDKTSIMFSVTDRVGALHDMLVPFKNNNINLTKIESRPSRKRAWEYYFFVDAQGHIQNPRLKKAIAILKKRCTYLKILGSYPQEAKL
jgi:chorismate mutase/prephenate dehydratase